MTTVAHEAKRPVFVPPRPSWGDAFAATIIGWVAASLLVLVPVLLAHWLGLVSRPGVAGLGGDGLRDWPYPENGGFSLVANTIVWLELLAFSALLVRGALADRVGPISAVPIFVVIAVTGLAPLLPHGLLYMPLPVQLLATVWLVRAAVATTPVRPLPKRVTMKIVAVGALLLAIPAAYGFTHPLWYGAAVGETLSDPPQRSPVKEFTFGLRNAGVVDVRVEEVSVALEAPVADVVDVRVDRTPPTPPGSPFPASPRPPFTIPARDQMFVQLRLRERGCGGPGRGAAVIRYEQLGASRTARIPLNVRISACGPG